MKKKFYTVDCWNLNDLELRGDPKKRGEITWIDISPLQNKINKILVLENLFLLCDFIDRKIEIINKDGKHRELLFWNEEENVIDADIFQNTLYLLDEKNKKIVSYEYIKFENKFEKKEVFVFSLKIPLGSKMVIGSNDLEQKLAYICLNSEEQILRIVLNETISTTKIELKIANGKKKLGSQIFICLDQNRKTILISDTNNFRLLETNYEDGETVVIAGLNKPGDSIEGSLATNAFLNQPKGLVIYRFLNFFDRSLLNNQSRSVLDNDPTNSEIRTIIIADAGNFKVKRIDTFFDIDRLDPVFITKVYHLIGYGKKKIREFSDAEIKDDLRKQYIESPKDLAVNNVGELLILFENTNLILLLSPSLSVSSEMIYTTAISAKVNES